MSGRLPDARLDHSTRKLPRCPASPCRPSPSRTRPSAPPVSVDRHQRGAQSRPPALGQMGTRGSRSSSPTHEIRPAPRPSLATWSTKIASARTGTGPAIAAARGPRPRGSKGPATPPCAEPRLLAAAGPRAAGAPPSRPPDLGRPRSPTGTAPARAGSHRGISQRGPAARQAAPIAGPALSSVSDAPSWRPPARLSPPAPARSRRSSSSRRRTASSCSAGRTARCPPRRSRTPCSA